MVELDIKVAMLDPMLSRVSIYQFTNNRATTWHVVAENGTTCHEILQPEISASCDTCHFVADRGTKWHGVPRTPLI